MSIIVYYLLTLKWSNFMKFTIFSLLSVLSFTSLITSPAMSLEDAGDTAPKHASYPARPVLSAELGFESIVVNYDAFRAAKLFNSTSDKEIIKHLAGSLWPADLDKQESLMARIITASSLPKVKLPLVQVVVSESDLKTLERGASIDYVELDILADKDLQTGLTQALERHKWQILKYAMSTADEVEKLTLIVSNVTLGSHAISDPFYFSSYKDKKLLEKTPMELGLTSEGADSISNKIITVKIKRTDFK